MNKEELLNALKTLGNDGNIETITQIGSAINALASENEELKGKNQALQDKLVDWAFKMPVKREKDDNPPIVPKIEEEISVAQAIAEWEESRAK